MSQSDSDMVTLAENISEYNVLRWGFPCYTIPSGIRLCRSLLQ